MVDYMSAVNDHLAANSDEFFAYDKPKDFRIEHRKVELFHTGSAPPRSSLKTSGESSCASPRRYRHPSRRTTWSTRAGFLPRDIAL